jgi:hypothetical protein
MLLCLLFQNMALYQSPLSFDNKFTAEEAKLIMAHLPIALLVSNFPLVD